MLQFHDVRLALFAKATPVLATTQSSPRFSHPPSSLTYIIISFLLNTRRQKVILPKNILYLVSLINLASHSPYNLYRGFRQLRLYGQQAERSLLRKYHHHQQNKKTARPVDRMEITLLLTSYLSLALNIPPRNPKIRLFPPYREREQCREP